MNIVLNIPDFDEKSIYFTDTKTNTHLPNSTFNRITYSSEDFMMSGIYIHFELYIKHNEKNYNNNVYIYYFDPNHDHNKLVINSFIQIENNILNKWTNVHKSHNNTRINEIEKHFLEGAISVWNQDINITDKPAFHTFIIKIAGVWENEAEKETGLTYKFI